VITANLRRAHLRYAGAPIRSFVPVLVERELMAQLRPAPTGPHAPTGPDAQAGPAAHAG
jgi:hypothetical protein